MTPKEMYEKMSEPYLVYEISELLESGVELDAIIGLIEGGHPSYKFNRTEKAYDSCIMAWFEGVE